MCIFQKKMVLGYPLGRMTFLAFPHILRDTDVFSIVQVMYRCPLKHYKFSGSTTMSYLRNSISSYFFPVSSYYFLSVLFEFCVQLYYTNVPLRTEQKSLAHNIFTSLQIFALIITCCSFEQCWKQHGSMGININT